MLPITPEDAGCWIEGHWGHHAVPRLIEIAVQYGLDAVGAMILVEEYPNISDEEYDLLFDYADVAEEYLNSLAPEGHYFFWYDGEFFLGDDWQEAF